MFRFQNRINHISREDTIPYNQLSSLYTATQSQSEEIYSASYPEKVRFVKWILFLLRAPVCEDYTRLTTIF